MILNEYVVKKWFNLPYIYTIQNKDLLNLYQNKGLNVIENANAKQKWVVKVDDKVKGRKKKD